MKLVWLLMAAAVSVTCLEAADIQLAKDGKALYTIVERPDAERLEKASVKDLKWHLDKITGGDFKIGKADSKRIFVGIKAPGDNEPMAKGERRLRSVNGDIYIYGEATDSAAFGIYDLLEKHCGCRWYTVWGESRIPSDKNLTLPELKDNKIPPFWRFETTSIIGIGTTQRVLDFLRRHRVHITPGRRVAGDDNYLLGAPIHTFCKYIPSGNVPVGKHVNNIGDPYKYFVDKKYFHTNPEWFTLDEKGKRVWNRQLCFSNKELRKELLKNLEIVIAKEYKGGDGMISVEMNDRAQYLCFCKGCKKLEEKYATPGGPFYDYLFELSDIFKKKYPRIIIRSLAYGCTLTPPNRILPENIMMWFAPLGGIDFLKSYEDVEDTRAPENLKLQGSSSKALWKWMYTSPFYRGTQSIAHIAAIKRAAINMRLYHKYNIRSIMTEHGLFVNGFTNFQELRVYLIFRLKEDLSQDENAIIREYMEGCYGKAADKMYMHLMELEKLNKNSNSIVKYNNIRPWNLDYITPQRLLKWQGDFNAMEKLVADDPQAMLHVKRARISVDQVTMGRWADIAEIRKSYTRRRFNYFRRNYLKYCKQVLDSIYNDPAVPQAQLKKWRSGMMVRLRDAVKPASPVKEAVQAPQRPLPEKFAGIPAENIQRCPLYPAVPRRFNRDTKSKAPADSKGAFGVSFSGKSVSTMNFLVRADYTLYFSNKIRLKDVRKNADGEFNYYYLGRINLGPSGGWFPIGMTRPPSCAAFNGFGTGICEADFYLSIKYEKGRTYFDELLIVKVKDLERKPHNIKL